MSYFSESERFNFSYLVKNSDYCQNESISRLELFDENIHNYTIYSSKINQANWVHSVIDNLRFVDVEIVNSEMRLVRFTNCTFKNVIFDSTYMSKCHFDKCNLINCKFVLKNSIDSFEFLDIQNSVLTDVDFSEVYISDLSESVIQKCILENVTILKSAVDQKNNIFQLRKKNLEIKNDEKNDEIKSGDAKKNSLVETLGDTVTPQDAKKSSGRFSGIEL